MSDLLSVHSRSSGFQVFEMVEGTGIEPVTC